MNYVIPNNSPLNFWYRAFELQTGSGELFFHSETRHLGFHSQAETEFSCISTKISNCQAGCCFVSLCDGSLMLRLAAIWKILSGRKDLQKWPKRSLLQLLFPYATWRRSTNGLLEQAPRSKDRRASTRMAHIATSPLRSTSVVTPRSPSVFAKSKP